MDEVLARHTSAQLTDWMAYERVTGPLGPDRQDLMLAIVAATVANTARGKGQRAREPKDFLPKWDQNAPGMGWEEMLTAVKTMNQRLGGADLREGGSGDDPGRDPRSRRDAGRRPRRRRAGRGE